MALTYPVSLANFVERLKVTGLSFHAPVPLQESRTAGGEILRARMGASLHQGNVTLHFERHRAARQTRVMLDLLMEPGASFLLSPSDYDGPQEDPGGAILGAATVTLNSVAANNRDVTFGGFPSGYHLRRGDAFSFGYGSNPFRRAFHWIVTYNAFADSGGVLSAEVYPPIRPGWSTGATVELIKPVIKAVIRSREPGAATRQIFHDGMSFSYIQTLR